MSQDKLTKLACGQPCQVRLIGCDGGGISTVGAHFRDLSLGSGMGRKTESWCLAWACFSCHQKIDFREQMTHGPSRDSIRLAHAIGVLRTIQKLIEAGKIKLC